MARELTIKYQTYKFVNKLFWALLLIIEVIELISGFVWLHDFRLGLINGIILILIFGIQQLILRKVHQHESEDQKANIQVESYRIFCRN